MSDALLAALGSRPLCVSPHPDDEAWAFGGLLAALADSPSRPALLCLTASPGSPRSLELRAAWAALGGLPEDLHEAALPDGALRPEVASRALAERLEALAPSAVITFGPDGGYGHRDHVAAWEAVATSREAEFHVKHAVAWPVFRDADARFAPLRSHLARTAPALLALASDAPAPPATLFHLALSPALRARKRAALACHASQLPRGGVEAFLGRAVMAPLLVAEDYAVSRPVVRRAPHPARPHGAGHLP